MADGLLVALDSAADGHLGRPMQVLEQTPDMVLVVRDAELFVDDEGDAGAGPDLPAQPVSLRPVPEELWDLALLSRRELGRPACRRPRQQGFGSALATA